MNDHDLHAFVEAWLRWCATRRFFVKRSSTNLLAQMLPAKINEPPNARMSADLSWFNMAVHALVDMGDDDAPAFMRFYVERANNIKAVAAEMGVARSTFYVKVRRFARHAWTMAQSLKRADNQLRGRSLPPDAVD